MNHYFAFGGSVAAFSLLIAWMFISSRVAVWVRAVIAVVAVTLALVVWLQVTALLGYAVNGEPRDGSRLIAFVLARPLIYLWALEDWVPRSYVIPYGEGAAKELFDAQREAARSNGRMVYHRHGAPGVGIGRAVTDLRDTKEARQPMVTVESVLPEKR